SELNHKSLQIRGTKTLLPAVDTTVFEWRSNVNTALSGMRTGRLRCTAQPTAGRIAVSNDGFPPSITQKPHNEMRSPSTGQKRLGTVFYCDSQVSRGAPSPALTEVGPGGGMGMEGVNESRL